jgi:hypothetical protein
MRAQLAAVALAAAAFMGQANADTSDPLAPLAFFQGCWHGAFAGSTTVTDDRCFASMRGHYVRDTHDVRGAPEAYGGETIYYFDPQAHRIAFTYYASDGGIARGFADADGQGLVFPPGQYVGADGSTITIRSTWRPDGPDRYVSVAEFQENGQWREHLRITYTRATDLATPH